MTATAPEKKAPQAAWKQTLTFQSTPTAGSLLACSASVINANPAKDTPILIPSRTEAVRIVVGTLCADGAWLARPQIKASIIPAVGGMSLKMSARTSAALEGPVMLSRPGGSDAVDAAVGSDMASSVPARPTTAYIAVTGPQANRHLRWRSHTAVASAIGHFAEGH